MKEKNSWRELLQCPVERPQVPQASTATVSLTVVLRRLSPVRRFGLSPLPLFPPPRRAVPSLSVRDGGRLELVLRLVRSSGTAVRMSSRVRRTRITASTSAETLPSFRSEATTALAPSNPSRGDAASTVGITPPPVGCVAQAPPRFPIRSGPSVATVPNDAPDSPDGLRCQPCRGPPDRNGQSPGSGPMYRRARQGSRHDGRAVSLASGRIQRKGESGYGERISFTQVGTSSLASPYLVSMNADAVSDGSRFSFSVRAPAPAAVATNPAAG